MRTTRIRGGHASEVRPTARYLARPLGGGPGAAPGPQPGPTGPIQLKMSKLAGPCRCRAVAAAPDSEASPAAPPLPASERGPWTVCAYVARRPGRRVHVPGKLEQPRRSLRRSWAGGRTESLGSRRRPCGPLRADMEAISDSDRADGPACCGAAVAARSSAVSDSEANRDSDADRHSETCSILPR